MSNNYDMMKKVGREKFTFIQEYADQRIHETRTQLDNAGTIEEVRGFQGRISEMKWLKQVLESYKEI